MASDYPSPDETLKHPAYPGTIWGLEPHQKGVVAAAKDGGGPINISWEIHGDGPVWVVLIIGLAGVKWVWQRQTLHFGHNHGDRYSVLLVENRGMGESDKPTMRYSTSAMAHDVLEVLDHMVGWTGKAAARRVHAVGISLGGMIAQELACLAPDRLASLTLLSSAARYENTKDWWGTVQDRLSLLVPKSLPDTIVGTARDIFGDEAWLRAPDDAVLPSPKTTPRCRPAPARAMGDGDGEYKRFDSNFQRFQAQELAKREDPDRFSPKGFFLQLLAAGWHNKSEEQLRAMADAVGRERIAVLHGTRDDTITVMHGQKLIRFLEPAVGDIVEGLGHVPFMERAEWFNEWLEARLANGEKVSGRT